MNPNVLAAGPVALLCLMCQITASRLRVSNGPRSFNSGYFDIQREHLWRSAQLSARRDARIERNHDVQPWERLRGGIAVDITKSPDAEIETKGGQLALLRRISQLLRFFLGYLDCGEFADEHSGNSSRRSEKKRRRVRRNHGAAAPNRGHRTDEILEAEEQPERNVFQRVPNMVNRWMQKALNVSYIAEDDDVEDVEASERKRSGPARKMMQVGDIALARGKLFARICAYPLVLSIRNIVPGDSRSRSRHELDADVVSDGPLRPKADDVALFKAVELFTKKNTEIHERELRRQAKAEAIKIAEKKQPSPLESAENAENEQRKPADTTKKKQLNFFQRVRKLIPVPLPILGTFGGLYVFHRDHTRLRLDKELNLQRLSDFVTLKANYHMTIVTTAALPWMTGTAVNPLLRAAYLAKAGKRVTLMVPWVHPSDQELIFPKDLHFATPAAQDAYIQRWVRGQVGNTALFRIAFYPARYDTVRGSIMPLGDITRFFSAEESDICVLEEPEHLTWYHFGKSWRHRFKLVVGVVHTNYQHYAEMCRGRLYKISVSAVNYYMCQAYCDAVVKLSDTLQELPNSLTRNVHGVREAFFEIGATASWKPHVGGVYFIGKALWPKGYRLLLDYLKLQRANGESRTHIDMFGDGEDLEDIKDQYLSADVDVDFKGRIDHADLGRQYDYKVFANPSESEVLSTTTAEALAMGKFVILKRHPSNTFFEQFANALFFDNPREFLLQLRFALAATPEPLTERDRYQLTWEGATNRFLETINDVIQRDLLPSQRDRSIELLHKFVFPPNFIGDFARKVSGAGPVAKQGWLRSRSYGNETHVVRIVDESLRVSPSWKRVVETYYA